MRFASLAGLMAILSLAAGAPPAAAQTLPRDLFLPPKRPVAPASADSVAHGFNLSAAPLSTSRFHPVQCRRVVGSIDAGRDNNDSLDMERTMQG